MRTVNDVINKSEFNKFCIAYYCLNWHARGAKQALRDQIGRYDADIIIRSSISNINTLYREAGLFLEE